MAVPQGKVSIFNLMHDEYMYAGVNGPKHSSDRRFVLTWGRKGTPETEPDMVWKICSFDGGKYYGIKHVLNDEWLYVGNWKYNEDRRYALTWGGKGDPTSEHDMRFCIAPFNTDAGAVFGIQSVLHNQWIYAYPMHDKDRRYVLAWGRPGTPANEHDMRWIIKSLEPQVATAPVLATPSVTVLHLTAHLEELLVIDGGADGTQEMKIEYYKGCTLTQEERKNAATIATEASRRLQTHTQSTSQGKAEASYSVDPSLLSGSAKASYEHHSSQGHNEQESHQSSASELNSFAGALASTSISEKKEFKSTISLAKPCYFYQAVVNVHMSDGNVHEFRGALKQSSTPISTGMVTF